MSTEIFGEGAFSIDSKQLEWVVSFGVRQNTNVIAMCRKSQTMTIQVSKAISHQTSESFMWSFARFAILNNV
jgi:hypothetical protein